MTTDPQYVMVPREPTEEMWSGLARQIVLWQRMYRHSSSDSLFESLNLSGVRIPHWLRREISSTDHTVDKGTVAVCIYKAMIAAAPPPQPSERELALESVINDIIVDACELPNRTSPPDYPGMLLMTPDELRGFLNHVAALAIPSPEPGGWQPIVSAPKDGTPVLGFLRIAVTTRIATIFWDDGAWYIAYICADRPVEFRATHWMPLPPPPAPERAE